MKCKIGFVLIADNRNMINLCQLLRDVGEGTKCVEMVTVAPTLYCPQKAERRNFSTLRAKSFIFLFFLHH